MKHSLALGTQVIKIEDLPLQRGQSFVSQTMPEALERNQNKPVVLSPKKEDLKAFPQFLAKGFPNVVGFEWPKLSQYHPYCETEGYSEALVAIIKTLDNPKRFPNFQHLDLWHAFYYTK